VVTIHHLENSRSQRVLWLLEELGVDYEVVRYQRDKLTLRAPASLRALHPLGKSPLLTEGDETLAETGAIIEYVVQKYGQGRLIPATGTQELLRYRYWLHYAEGSAMPQLLMKLVFGRIANAPAPILLRPLMRLIAHKVLQTQIEPQLALHIAFWEAELEKNSWFAGPDFTAADIQMSFPIEAAAARAGIGDGFPQLMGFLERIHVRAAYKRALDRGGPYALLS
jgi:glutathione S-transferase